MYLNTEFSRNSYLFYYLNYFGSGKRTGTTDEDACGI